MADVKKDAKKDAVKKPGVCQQIRDYCAKNPKLDRKTMCANLVKQGFAKGTIQVQVGKWMKGKKPAAPAAAAKK